MRKNCKGSLKKLVSVWIDLVRSSYLLKADATPLWCTELRDSTYKEEATKRQLFLLSW